MLADTLVRPLRFRITPGQASDITSAPALLEGQRAKAVLANKACDSNDLRDKIAALRPKQRSRPRETARSPSPMTLRSTKHRNRIERGINRLKHFQRFATRYGRRAIHFSGFVHLGRAMIWLR